MVSVRAFGRGVGSQYQFEKKLGYAVAAFEAEGHRPRDEDVYLMYGRPGRMLGRFTHRNCTLCLFVCVVDSGPPPTTLDLQKEMLREKYTDGGWECSHILQELGNADELYFDSVSQIRMNSWSIGRISLTGAAAFCVSLLAGQGSALAMISAYVLAGELLQADGRHQEAFPQLRSVFAGLHPNKAAKRRAVRGRVGTQDKAWPAVPQLGYKGIRGT